MSFGLLPLWRRQASQHARPEHVALEIGPATGGFARLLPCHLVYLLEPSAAMVRYTRAHLPEGRYVPLQGVAEGLPLGGATVDRVFCTFSFRDFVDPVAACSEILRVLRPGGQLHMVDVTRPPPGLGRCFLDSWVTHGAPALAEVLIPADVRRVWGENPYESFRRTYFNAPSTDGVASILRRCGFEGVRLRSLGLRGAFHAVGVRPRTT